MKRNYFCFTKFWKKKTTGRINDKVKFFLKKRKKTIGKLVENDGSFKKSVKFEEKFSSRKSSHQKLESIYYKPLEHLGLKWTLWNKACCSWTVCNNPLQVINPRAKGRTGDIKHWVWRFIGVVYQNYTNLKIKNI